MKTESSPGYYPAYEEKLNVISHGFGFGLSILGLVLLLHRAVNFDDSLLHLDLPGLLWIVVGGVSYTIGAVFFSLGRIKYNHAIFHLFVLAGTFCHFLAIYFYVLPGEVSGI